MTDDEANEWNEYQLPDGADADWKFNSEPEIRIRDMSWFFESLGSDTIEAEIDWEDKCVILRRHDDE